MGMEGFPPPPAVPEEDKSESVEGVEKAEIMANAENDPDKITAEDLEDIQSRLTKARIKEQMKNPDQLSDEELKQFGITKEIGEHGETRYDYGHNQDTGRDMKALSFQTKPKRITFNSEAEEKAFFDEVEKRKREDDERREKEKDTVRLPSVDDYTDEELERMGIQRKEKNEPVN